MSTKTPTLRQVKNKFKQAKEIRCLNTGSIIGVKNFTSFEFDESKNQWAAAGGEIVFWKDGAYAEITKKCGNCKNCGDRFKKPKQ